MSTIEVIGYVGVVKGKPVTRHISDSRGETNTIEVYKTQEEAHERWHNVRRVRVIVDNEPLCPPDDWGMIDD